MSGVVGRTEGVFEDVGVGVCEGVRVSGCLVVTTWQ